MKTIKIELNEFEVYTIMVTLMHYIAEMKERKFKMEKTEELLEKFIDIKEKEPF